MNTVHGRKVVTRKPKAGDKVVSKTSGREYVVTEVIRSGRHTTTLGVVSTGFRGLPNAFAPNQVATLSKR